MSLISRSWLTAMQGKRGGKRQKKKTPRTDEDDAEFDQEHDYMEEFIMKTYGTKTIGLGTGQSKALLGVTGEITQKATI